MSTLAQICQANSELLHQGKRLIQSLDEETFTRNEGLFHNSGVSKHMRHILDFFSNVLAQDGEPVNYDRRFRNTEDENNRDAAIARIEVIDQRLTQAGQTAHLPLQVTENIPNTLTQSSMEREMLFLLSHTVHHYAIIALLLEVQGIQVPKGFGVAPSTLVYHGQQAVS